MRKIVVTGNIGCGKTSTLTNIQCNFEYNDSKKIVIVLEKVEDWQWLLNQSYISPKQFTTLLQVQILGHFLEVAEQIDKFEKMADGDPRKPDFIMMERAPLDVLKIFLEVAKPNIGQKEYDALVVIVERLVSMDQWKNMEYFFLDIPIDVCYKRKNMRGRQGEELISMDYLTQLAELYEKYPFNHRIKIDGKPNVNKVADLVCRKIVGFGFDDPSPRVVRSVV